MLDYSFENPLDGELKSSPPFVRTLTVCGPDSEQPMVWARKTSYCHYGYDYRKRTVFLTTLEAFAPAAPCPCRPCARVAGGGVHASTVAGSAPEQKNSIPPLLVDEILDAWVARHAANNVTLFVLVDVFAGWSSFKKRILQRQSSGELQNVRAFANDIRAVPLCDANVDLEQDALSPMSFLLLLALRRSLPSELAWELEQNLSRIYAWIEEARVAVLFHVSTPCETYSTNGLGKHRPKGGERSKKARTADEMNAHIFAWLRFHVHRVA